jgi:hypothetical protein
VRQIKISTPPSPLTKLRIEAAQISSGERGDYLLTAFNGAQEVYSQRFAWNVWLGHACGELLMPKFVANAERAAHQKY